MINQEKVKRIFIVEDESELAENLETLLEYAGYVVLGIEGDGASAYHKILDLEPDLILMDIKLPGWIDGIELTDKIKKNYDIPIIFLTANADETYLERISNINYESFILKPFTKEVLITTINLTLLKHSKKRTTKNILKIRDKGSIVHLDEDSIIMLKADGLYTRIYSTEKQYVIREILKDISEKVSEKKFVRIHKSFLINLNYVVAFNAKEVNVANFVVPIRRGYFRELGDLLIERLNS